MADSFYALFFTWLLTALVLYYLFKNNLTKAKYSSSVHHPLSPPALPLIGHLHLVKSDLLQSLQTLARVHGPLMQIRLGASSFVVVSNAEVAKEVMKTQELNFSSRPAFGSAEYSIYRGSGFAMAEYGEYWRFVKKLCMTRLLSAPQLAKFADIREQEVVRLLQSLRRSEEQGLATDLSSELTALTNNIICRMAMTTRCSDSDEDAKEIKELVDKIFSFAVKLSVGDVLGPLRFLDFSGNGKKLMTTLLKYDEIVERILKEHQEKASTEGGGGDRKDLMDILLEVSEDPAAELKLTRKDIKSFLLDIFVAGTETSSNVMQCAMTELINHPQTFKKLRDEITAVMGSNKLVQDSDIPNLPYLRAVIRETLRLHPLGTPVMRQCAEDCKVNGYFIPAKTRVLINLRAVMRDPDSWKDPDQFLPERFMGSSEEWAGDHKLDYKGQNFRFMPFGSGRRGCPGSTLAMEVMHVVVGNLVRCFDWKFEEGDKAEIGKPLVCYPVTHFNPLSGTA